jgi:arabinogalactan endo-1,4-beta-galactosidase
LSISGIPERLPPRGEGFVTSEKCKNLPLLVKTAVHIRRRIGSTFRRCKINRSNTPNTAGGLSILGADVSSLQQALDLGAEYFHEDGSQGDPLQILQSHGVNYIRLRVWVNPANGFNSKTRVVEFAQKVKARGLKLLIDLHYSDTWADPLHQAKPAAWASHSFDQLQTDVYDHTYDVCVSLKNVNAMPDMLQVGNEINPGMLFPDGSTQNWSNLSSLLKQGYNAVKACSVSIQVMLHLANAGDKAGACEWFDNAANRGVPWDVTGLSYYSYWHGTTPDMTDTVKEMKLRYGKPVVIAETAYPFTLLENDDEMNSVHSESQLSSDYPATPAGQAGNLRAVMKAVRMGDALGVFYWEPTWTAVKGNGWDPTNPGSGCQWENQALFDYNGKALPAMKEFKSEGHPGKGG